MVFRASGFSQASFMLLDRPASFLAGWADVFLWKSKNGIARHQFFVRGRGGLHLALSRGLSRLLFPERSVALYWLSLD